ncbi:hypothetical protein J4573_06140 [Actinomadura barringtoniae]|uniref:Uncharacterized protein n=1 Tax=Actinomadura barringtoniae TaxID=1427535 RepID=A0A939T2I6_9ACTN|nr:hypothetical protein [Actinomadura barringtoniae]MBO2446663.1 hypothetical protein [Actinomadura barringtoniae]
MSSQQPAWHDGERLGELMAEFAGWRIGRGGSGHWWAVRGNELVRTLNVEELRARLHELEEIAAVPRSA